MFADLAAMRRCAAVPISDREKTVTDLRLGMNSASSFHM
jgi:hypothetical protein